MNRRSSSPTPPANPGSYFPLDVGDRWVYRIDNRTATATYQTWRVDRTEEIGGETWYVVEIESNGTLLAESRFHIDERGNIYTPTEAGDHLFLDATLVAGSSATLQVTGVGGSYSNALGTFQDVLSYRNQIDALTIEIGTLARGVGLLTSRRDMLSGSSGGFYEGRTLMEASLAGGVHFGVGSPSLQLGIERMTLDVSGRNVTNCAVPCYFVACRLMPGADPPNTYKPCAQARVQLGNWPVGASRSLRLQLIADDGTTAYDQTTTTDAALDESVLFVQLPLYSLPNVPLPPGAYRLTAAAGDGAAQSSLTLKIQ